MGENGLETGIVMIGGGGASAAAEAALFGDAEVDAVEGSTEAGPAIMDDVILYAIVPIAVTTKAVLPRF